MKLETVDIFKVQTLVKVPEESIPFWRYPTNSIPTNLGYDNSSSVLKMNSIHSVVLIQYRHVTDKHVNRPKIIAFTMQSSANMHSHMPSNLQQMHCLKIYVPWQTVKKQLKMHIFTVVFNVYRLPLISSICVLMDYTYDLCSFCNRCTINLV